MLTSGSDPLDSAGRFESQYESVMLGRATGLKSKAPPDTCQSHMTKFDTCKGHLCVLGANLNVFFTSIMLGIQLCIYYLRRGG